jgi:hypothetical protein
MAQVPSGTRFIGIATSADLVERKSAVLNAQTQPFTIEDIGDTVGSSASTKGIVASTNSAPFNVLEYDINTVTGNSGDTIILPLNAPIGKVVSVTSSLSTLNVKAYNQGSTISVNNSSSNTNNYSLSSFDTVKFISLGSDFWLAEIISGTNITYNGKKIGTTFGYVIIDTVSNATVTPLSASTLNTTYQNASYPLGTKIICSNIGLMYIKISVNGWVSIPITAVV